MSDKSFGDHTNRNIVKNPLLSSAVTGLSLEDLTHKAVLLPVSPSQGQITRPDQQQGSQTRTLVHADRETPTSPSGDAFSNIALTNIPQITNPNVVDGQNKAKLEKNRDTPNATQSKASLKSDDDFDVNEYIARLQGSRYVSAPLHSHLKEDKNANLEATEENLEEINLNESQSHAEVQQSLTADIAHNFSQLPTVLPHVASAVFNSFSNMLSYKSREQTPDRANVNPNQGGNKGYDDVQLQRADVGVSMIGMENYGPPREVAAPPKEPPIGGSSNFRITTKKKYAQIPGLSSGDSAPTMTYNAPGQNIPIGQNLPPIGQYNIGQNLPPSSGPNIAPIGQKIASTADNTAPLGQNMPPPSAPLGQNLPPSSGHNMPPFAPIVAPIGQRMPPFAPNIAALDHTMPPFIPNLAPKGQNMPPIGKNVHTFFNPNEAKINEPFQPVVATAEVLKRDENNVNTQVIVSQHNIFNPIASENQDVKEDVSVIENEHNTYGVTKDNQENFFTPIEHKEQAKQNIPQNPNVPATAAIIPPPPMFSNLPKRDSHQPSIGKSILPPSVARRISGNQPIIKPAVSTPSFSENVFIPASVSETAIESSGQAENRFPTGFSTSAFVPGFTTPNKLDPTAPPSGPASLAMHTPSIAPASFSVSVPTYFTPSNEKPQTATEGPKFFSPQELAAPAATTFQMAPLSIDLKTPISKSTIDLSFMQGNVPPPFLPPTSTFNESKTSAVPTSTCPPREPEIVPPSPTFFNPLQHADISSANAPHPITQFPPMANPETPKPVPDPPKASGNVNFRMTKKRPQYYAGPIEGVGAISNNFKPVIAPIIPSATSAEATQLQGGLFTPEQPLQPAIEQFAAPYIEPASIPFDISRPVDNVISQTTFNINKPQEQAYGLPFNLNQPENQSYGLEYNTAFDMSRTTSETYEPPKQESRGFGIIGSLKSKLSSIDINKIQSTVTTFFDPAYNESKVAAPVAQDNTPYRQEYEHQQFGQSSQGQANFDFGPNIKQSQYSQFKHTSYDYNPDNQYYQTQNPYAQNQAQAMYLNSGSFIDQSYTSEQVYAASSLYDINKENLAAVTKASQDKIPVETSIDTSKSIDNGTFYNSNVFTQETTPSIGQQQSFSLPSQQNVEDFVVATDKVPDKTVFDNPNAYGQENRQMLYQQCFDTSVSSQPTADRQNKITSSIFTPEKNQETTFYDPNAFTSESQILNTQQPLNVFGSGIQQKSYQVNEAITSKAHKTTTDDQEDSHPICDSALNTSKYNMSSIQTPGVQQNVTSRVPLVPAASFFDNTLTINQSQLSKADENEQVLENVEEQFESKNIEINKMLADTPVPSNTKSRDDIAWNDEQNKVTEADNEKMLKEKNLIESLAKDDIPILGVSTVPLFGLSAMIAEKSREISESENITKTMSLYETAQSSRSLFEGNTGPSFFENMAPPNKPMNEIQARKTQLDITGLTINDVKNVLLFEPPQENIGALLKRNASSGKLESLTKTEEASNEHFRQQNDNLPSTAFQEKLHIKFDENASEIFFKHLPSEKEDKDLEKESSVESQDSELNICETCREVNTPDFLGPGHKETEYLTNQMIENITSRMPLSNPLTVPLTESNTLADERSQFDDQQFDEITHIAEDTIETLQVQSATDLLDEEITSSDAQSYGWTTEDAAYCAASHIEHDTGFKVDTDTSASKEDYGFARDANPPVSGADNDYEFKFDPNVIGFFDNNSIFFDNLPKNASDEIKAEIKNSQEDVAQPRQTSIPSASPVEDDTKSDETGGLDVHSIEQDAKNDFPLEEEFVIEPSETDDDKIEFRERKKSSEESFTLQDTFTNRIDRFKKEIDNPNDNTTLGGDVYGNNPMPMASYFDTGNYAVEAHYKNSLSSPTSINMFHNQYNMMRIPPGFEEEYARRLSGLSLNSGDNRYEVRVPDTSTQTRQISTTTYSSPGARENVIGAESRRHENIEAFVESKTEPHVPNILQTKNSPLANASIPNFTGFTAEGTPVHTSRPVTTEDPSFDLAVDNTSDFNDQSYSQPEDISHMMHNLPDPKNFFAANVEEDEPATEAGAPENFNRLASYFSMTPAQPEPSKPFFELSQSQNHYRHESKAIEGDAKNGHKRIFELGPSQNHCIDDDAKNNIKNLMKDLTAPNNIQENVVKTVHYFTVEYDNDIKPPANAAKPINIKINDPTKIEIPKVDTHKSNVNKHVLDHIKLTENDRKHFEAITNCKICRLNVSGINTKDFKVRTAVNDTSEVRTEEITTETENTGSATTTTTMTLQNYDLEGQGREGVAVLNEHRPTSEYSPVEHHWFYRVDVEEKSVWRGFSLTDSRKLEETFNSPELNDATLVATDGGRYDVNLIGRLRLAVYWKEKPTNVRRCSWFYKGTTDARYVPYTEAVAAKLEEEYRHGITTGEWHRRLSLPNSEMVIMHGPSVMVHFLHSGTTDAFSTPPSVLGKRVYRSPPKIKVTRDQKSTIDHLILLVHGAGEYKRYPFLEQATSRPRVVRRGHEESEIEDPEPSRIDHLLLLCHGVGSACDMRFRPVEEVVEDFRTTTLQLLQSHYRNSYENGVVSRVEVLPISWHAQLHSGENGVDQRLSRVTLDSIPRLRAFTNHTVLDVLFYTSPVFHQTIIDTVCSEVNRIYSMFRERNPHFKGEVSLGGHSLGSVILYDLLCHQMSTSPQPKSPITKIYVPGTAETDQPTFKYPQLVFSPAALYALGSPIAIFECIRGVESLGMNFALPTCKHFFNIFHPYDPIAYRIEPLINAQLQVVKPSQIPHHKGRKRMHLELKDTMARVGADLKQKLVESLRTTWNKWKASPPPEGQLEKVVEEEIEKEQLCEDGKEEASEQATPEMLGQLNNGRRIDYVLQEAPLEMINEYLFAMSSHVGYWESEDTMLLMLREIYSALGVQPDCSVPQQSMSVQRTRAPPRQDEANVINEKEFPSTSRGGT